MPDMISRFINYLDVGIIPDTVSRFIASDVNEIAFNNVKNTEETNNKKDTSQKQKLNYRCKNMTIDNDIVTPNKLDQEAEDILGSLENDVMKILKKTKYFDKVPEE